MRPAGAPVDVRMWGAIIERGPCDYGVLVTAVASGSETTVGVTDFRRVPALSMEEAEVSRETLIREVQALAAARGDRVVSLERLLWRLSFRTP